MLGNQFFELTAIFEYFGNPFVIIWFVMPFDIKIFNFLIKLMNLFKFIQILIRIQSQINLNYSRINIRRTELMDFAVFQLFLYLRPQSIFKTDLILVLLETFWQWMLSYDCKVAHFNRLLIVLFCKIKLNVI